MQKKSYTQPQLNTYGDVEVLTENTTQGTKLDAALPAGTPINVILSHLS